MKNPLKRQLGVAGLMTLVACSVAPYAEAATFRGGQEYILREGQVVSDNLHLLGNNLTIDGNVEGDLVAAAGRVEVNGSVQDDVLVAGGVVEINGTVGGDVRALGGQVIVRGAITGDLIGLGGTIEVRESATTTGDVALYGDRIVMGGTVSKALLVKGNILELNGSVGSNVQADIDEGIVVGDTARITGDFVYTARNEALISDIARENIGGEELFTPRDPTEGPVAGALSEYFGAFSMIKLLSVLAATLGLLFLLPRFSERVVRYALANTGRSLLVGAVVWIVVPIMALILALTIVGIVPALGIGLGYLTLLVLAKVVSGILAGAMIAYMFTRGYVISWKYAVLGVLAIFVIGLVPVAGFLVSLLVYWMVIGSLAVGMYEFWWKRRVAEPIPATVPAAPAPTSIIESPDNLPANLPSGREGDESPRI
jgi:cytoskeletal protein CcmA (bactofilin family)